MQVPGPERVVEKVVIVKEPEVIYKDREIEKVVEKERIVEVEKIVNRVSEVSVLESELFAP